MDDEPVTRASTTRDRLLDAAADILESQGLSQLNTNALAAKAGVTPPTVYRNFKNKEEVVIALALRFVQAEQVWLSQAGASLGNVDTLAQAVAILVDGYWTSARREQGIVALRGAMRVWPELQDVEQQALASSAKAAAQLLSPFLQGLSRKALARVARYTVETVCSAIDRCYVLAPEDQAWRIAHLKQTVVAYLEAQAG